MTLTLKSYTVERIPPDKSPAIWGMFEPNLACKLCILQKPKWMTDEQFDVIVKSIRAEGVPKDLFEETTNEN